MGIARAGAGGGAARVREEDARPRRGVKAGLAAAGALLLVVPALAGCDRDAGPDGDARRPAGVVRPFDADSAARGLLPPELAEVLAVEPVLARLRDTSAAEGRRCKVDTLDQLRHVTQRFSLRAGDTSTTLFARRTPQGELRRAEVLRRLPDGTALGATWDAADRKTTVTQLGGGRATQTTSRDADAPLARSLRYVGRAVLAAKCGEQGLGTRD